jgi:hypothetical protein
MFIQNAPGVAIAQPTAPVPYVQPAAGLYTVQVVAKVNITVARAWPGPMSPRNDSTALPVATVNAIGFLQSGASEWQAATFVTGDGLMHAHFTIGGGFAYKVGPYNIGGTGGIKFNGDGIRFLTGGTLAGGNKFDWSATMSSQTLPDHGSCASEGAAFVPIGAGVGFGGSYSPGGSPDIGFGKPGVSISGMCVL